MSEAAKELLENAIRVELDRAAHWINHAFYDRAWEHFERAAEIRATLKQLKLATPPPSRPVSQEVAR